MGENSKIEWCDATWNPLAGCAKVSPGCKNCYAERVAKRLAAMGQKLYQGTVDAAGRWTGKINVDPEKLVQPFGWKKASTVFVNSMSDLFHQEVPFEFIDQVFATMALCPQHKFLVLTKRPERMGEYLAECFIPGFTQHYATTHQLGDDTVGALRETTSDRIYAIAEHAQVAPWKIRARWPLENVWLGTSVENQEEADRRIPHLLQCPAAVRFLSVEPMLGPVDLTRIDWAYGENEFTIPAGRRLQKRFINALCGYCNNGVQTKIDWVICGGESGPNARPMNPEWARSLRDQCVSAGVPFFMTHDD